MLDAVSLNQVRSMLLYGLNINVFSAHDNLNKLTRPVWGTNHDTCLTHPSSLMNIIPDKNKVGKNNATPMAKARAWEFAMLLINTPATMQTKMIKSHGKIKTPVSGTGTSSCQMARAKKYCKIHAKIIMKKNTKKKARIKSDGLIPATLSRFSILVSFMLP